MCEKEKQDFRRYEIDRKRMQRANKKLNTKIGFNDQTNSPNTHYSCETTLSKNV